MIFHNLQNSLERSVDLNENATCVNTRVTLQASIFIKKRLQRRCFPLNIAKFLRKPILKNIYEWLLLK